MEMKRRIAVLMTVFNRKVTTLACLRDLYAMIRPEDVGMDI